MPQFCCGGLNFGYFYDRSPIIAYDGETAPPYTMDQFTPSTVPGCRTPHIWLRDGRSLYDAMGRGFFLLRFDRSVDVGAADRMPPRIVVLPLAVCWMSIRRPTYRTEARALPSGPACRLARRCPAGQSAGADGQNHRGVGLTFSLKQRQACAVSS